LWRTKEAFSDGVSKTTRSLYEIIQENVSKNNSTLIQNKNQNQNQNYNHNPPDTDEKKYYREIFEEAYPGLGEIIPYFWMPRYVEAKDASARTLKIYNEVKTDTS
jgi:asparagine synthase (glutamine-hydrolysing)